MIKNLKIRNNFETYTLSFSNNVNIIVGEKGTGKSTLLQIIAEAIINKKMFKNEYDWLRDKANFEILSVNIDDTEINAQDFGNFFSSETKENSKEKALLEIQKKLPGFISQNDNRKNSLDSTEHIEKLKQKTLDKFIEKISYNNEMKKCLNDFQELQNEQYEYFKLQERSLSFGLIFDPNFKFKNYDSITKNIQLLNYSNGKEIDNIKNQYNKVENIIELLQKLNLRYQDLSSNFNNDEGCKINKNIEDKFIKNINESFQRNVDSIQIFEEYLKELDKNRKALYCFSLAFKELQTKFKTKLQNNQKKEIDKDNLMKYFRDMGIVLKRNKNKYQEIIQKNIEINWELTENDQQNDNIQYKLEKFTLDSELEDEKYKILNLWLGCSNKSHTIADILQSGSSKKTYDIKKIIKELIKDKIKVYAGDEEYKNLSTGQKTLFGITHALKTLVNVQNEQYVLLDQVEDNLDNKTIYEKIVPMINKQKDEGKQIFIVTHNANIGTLIEGNTITADIFNEELKNKFIVNKKINIDNKINTPESLYLEGSMAAFEERKKIHETKIQKIKEGK